MTPTPETVVGTVPAATTSEEPPTSTLEGDAAERRGDLRLGRLRRLPHARGGGASGSDRPESRRVEARPRARRRPRHERRRRDARLRGPARASSRSPTSPRTSSSRPGLSLPPGFPRDVAAIACDLDRTLIAKDGVLRPRTIAAIARRPRGRHPRPDRDRAHVPLGAAVRRAAGIDEPLVCYQGAAVVDPATRRVPAARADPARARARGDRRRRGRGLRPQLLRRRRALRRRDDRARPRVRRLPAHADHARSATCSTGSSGRRRSSSSSTTPEALDALRPKLAAHFGERLFIAKSLPYFLELASPPSRRAAGSRSSPSTSASTRAADGRRSATARTTSSCSRRRAIGIAVDERRRGLKERADWVCPGADEEGVAQVIEAYLDSRAMIDLKAARNDPDAYRAALARKGAAEAFDDAARGRRALARARAADRRAARARRS